MKKIHVELFVRKEDGAATVDWVVLSAALVGLSVILVLTVGGGTDKAASRVSAKVATITIVP